MPAGAKGKYTPEVAAKIYDRIRIGVPKRHAAQSVGISEETFYQWINHKPEFAEGCAKAASEAVGRNVALIHKAADRDWRAASWWLERKHPEDFAERKKNEIELGSNTLAALLTDDQSTTTGKDTQ